MAIGDDGHAGVEQGDGGVAFHQFSERVPPAGYRWFYPAGLPFRPHCCGRCRFSFLPHPIARLDRNRKWRRRAGRPCFCGTTARRMWPFRSTSMIEVSKTHSPLDSWGKSIRLELVLDELVQGGRLVATEPPLREFHAVGQLRLCQGRRRFLPAGIGSTARETSLKSGVPDTLRPAVS